LTVAALAPGAEQPWPADVPEYKAPAAGEHPRLLFRKGDLAALKQRARTPEGQAVVKRLRAQLDGKDGETMTAEFNPEKGPVKSDGAGAYEGKAPLGAFTFSHAAGYGMLYQLTGEQKYAEFGRLCFEKALEGYRDRDRRYAFKAPFGALRAGPSLGWMALGYDLCHDGWDQATREKIAQVIANYNEGQWMSLDELAAGKRQHPGSNHWGMQVGGAALALLAIAGDPGVDGAKVGKLLEVSQKSMVRNLTEGFGDGGFFAEGDGTGSMSSHIVFLPALQAWRVAGGKDFIAPRPNAQWASLKWFFLSVPRPGAAPPQWFWPQRGGYPHNIWGRDDISGGGYFSEGFGVAAGDGQKAAILWFYNHSGLRELDEKNGTPLDTPSHYPHHSILSLVNWPIGMTEKNPGGIIPHAYRDTKWGFYAWRNRWQDADDVVISILTRAAKGNMGAKGEGSLSIWTGSGKGGAWGSIRGGFTGEWAPAGDGSTVLTTGDGSSLAIDFSRASGADVMLVMAGPGAPAAGAIDVGGTKLSFLFPGKGESPKPAVQGEQVVVGEQTVSFDGKRIVLGRMGAGK